MQARAKVDGNQSQIVMQLRGLGLSVRSTAMVGQGFPDIIVGYRGRNFIFEIKDPAQPPSKRRLTPLEVIFAEEWKGQVDMIEIVDDALTFMGIEHE